MAMFSNLVESKRKRQRSVGGTLTSALLHVGLIAGAVYATAHAAVEFEKPRQEKVDFLEVKKDEPPPPKEEAPPPPPDVVAAPPPPKGFQILTAPVEIPDVLPDINLSKKMSPVERRRAWKAGRPPWSPTSRSSNSRSKSR